MSDSATTPQLNLAQADCPDCGAVCVFEIAASETLTVECYACQHRFESSIEGDCETPTHADANPPRTNRRFFIYALFILALGCAGIMMHQPVLRGFVEIASSYFMPTVSDTSTLDSPTAPDTNSRTASGSASGSGSGSDSGSSEGGDSGTTVFTVTQQAMTVNDGEQGNTLDIAVIVSNTGTASGSPEVVIISLFDEADEVLVSWPILAPIAGEEATARPGESLVFTSQLFAPPPNIARMTVSVH